MSLAEKIALGSHSVNNMFIEGLICTVYMTCSLQCHVHMFEVKAIPNETTFFKTTPCNLLTWCVQVEKAL